VTAATPEFDAILEALEQGDLEAGLELLAARLSAAVTAAERYRLHLFRARLLAATGHVHEALADYDVALDHAGDAAQRGAVLLGRGELAESAGLLERAHADLTAASDLLTDTLERASAQQALGRLSRDHGNLEQGIVLLRAVHAGLQASGAGTERVAEAALDLAHALRLGGFLADAIDVLEDLVDTVEAPFAARILLQIGTTHGFAGQTERALDAYTRALLLLPSGAERAIVRYNRAVVLRERGELAGARDELERALVENAGEDRRVEYDALLLGGIVAREQDDLAAALDLLRAAADLGPEGDLHGRVRLELGTTLAATGLYGPAVTEFTAASMLCDDPADRGRAMRYRGMARHELGLVDEALADFEAALPLMDDPNERAQGLATVAILLAASGQRGAARSALDDALESVRDPALHRQLLVQRGMLLAELGDLDAAAADLTRVAKQSDAAGDTDLLARVLADLGVIHVARGAAGEAQAALERAASLAESGPVAHLALLQLGHLHVSRGAAHAATRAFERAAAAADDREARAAAFLARGNANLRWGRYAAARDDLTRVVALAPSPALLDQATVALRTTDHHLHHIAQTRAELTKVIQAHDTAEYRAQPTLQRGLLALAAGDSDAALVDLTRAVGLFRLRPERALACAHLALAHAQLGQCADAIAALTDAQNDAPDGDWLVTLAGNPNWDACRDHPAFPPALLGRGS
jgi:tetratricopeptide (TPR) repeat protein